MARRHDRVHTHRHAGLRSRRGTADLIPVLAACNRASYVTTVSQPGEKPARGYDGRLWTQRAAVEGLAGADTVAALRACAVGTPLIVLAGRRAAPIAEVQREALAELIRAAGLVHRIGMNLDQAVARLNATGSPGPDLGPAVAYCMQVLGRINAAALAIQRHLRS